MSIYLQLPFTFTVINSIIRLKMSPAIAKFYASNDLFVFYCGFQYSEPHIPIQTLIIILVIRISCFFK